MRESFFNYIEYEKRFSPHTITSYRKDLEDLNYFLTEAYEHDDMSKVDHSMLRSWLISLAERGLSSRTITRKIACIRSFYKFLRRKGVIDNDPTIRLKAPKLKKSLPVFIPEEDLNLLLDRFEYADDIHALRDKLIIELLYGTGLRLSELIALTLKDVNLHAGTIKVLGKGKKERIIPLNKSLVNLISIYIKEKGMNIVNSDEHLIVTDNGDQAYPVFIYRKVKHYLSQISNVDKRSPHVLRHTFATLLLNKGADLNAIKDLLGHSSLAATQVYTHNSIEKLKNIFDQAHPKA